MPITTFPTTIDLFNNPGPTTTTGDTGFYHDIEHDLANDAIAALETKVGIDNSVVTSSFDYIIKHHSHTGTDGSSRLGIVSVQPAVDQLSLSVSNAGSSQILGVDTRNAGPSMLLQPPIGTAIGEVLKGASGQTADLLQVQNSAGTYLAGIRSDGTLYSSLGLMLLKGLGGAAFLSTQASVGELDLLNGALLKGYSGALGTGQQLSLDTSTGILLLGGPTSGAGLRLNAFRANRMSTFQSDGKNNTGSGGIDWQRVVDADAQVYTARSLTTLAHLQKTADGTLGVTEQFEAFGFPAYDGVVTATKAIGWSVVPGTSPPLVAGSASLAGNLAVTGAVSVGSLTYGANAGGPLSTAVFPTNSAPRDVAAIGTGTTAARDNHVHGRETPPSGSCVQEQRFGGQWQGASANNNTAYVDMGGAWTFTKLYAGTVLRYDLAASLYTDQANSIIQFGLNIDGTDYDWSHFTINPINQHSNVFLLSKPTADIAGITAAAHTVKVRIKVTINTMKWLVSTDDFMVLRITEVWP